MCEVSLSRIFFWEHWWLAVWKSAIVDKDTFLSYRMWLNNYFYISLFLIFMWHLFLLMFPLVILLLICFCNTQFYRQMIKILFIIQAELLYSTWKSDRKCIWWLMVCLCNLVILKYIPASHYGKSNEINWVEQVLLK